MRILLILTILFIANITTNTVRADPIQVGAILPLSGDLTVFGEKMREGIQLAEENFPGKFKVIYEDGAFSNVTALSAFQKIASTSKAKAIIGPFGAGQTFSMAAQAQSKDIVLVAIALCNEDFAKWKMTLCAYPGLDAQLTPIFSYYKGLLEKPKKIGLLIEEVEGLVSARKRFKHFADEINATFILDKDIKTGELDQRTYLTKMRNADLIIYTGMPTGALTFTRMMREMRINPKHLWLFTEHDRKLWREHKEILEGVLLPGGLSKITPDFTRNVESRFGRPADLYHAIAHDSALSVFTALIKDPTLSGTKLTSALIEQHLPDTAIPGFYFDAQRSVHVPLDVDIIRGGEQINLLTQ